MEETRNNRRFYFIIAIIILVIIVFSLAVFLITRNKNKNVNKDNNELVLKCETSEIINEISVGQEISLYKSSVNDKKMIQRFIIQDNLDRDLNEIKDYFDSSIRTNLKNEYGDLQNFYKVNTTYNSDKIVIDVEYIINSKTSDAAASLFSIDLLNSSVDEIKSSFEEAGLKCEE